MRKGLSINESKIIFPRGFFLSITTGVAGQPPRRLVGFALVLFGAFGFSAKAILIKMAYAADINIDAITLMALRMLFSLPFFIVVAFWHTHLSAISIYTTFPKNCCAVAFKAANSSWE